MNNQDRIKLIERLNSNGIKSAVEMLNDFPFLDYCLFNADIAESVLYIFEADYPEDKSVRLLIQGIRDHHAGLMSGYELESLRAATYAASATYAYATAATAAYATAYAYATATAAAYATAYATARNEQWKKIEELFIKHFTPEEERFVGEFLFENVDSTPLWKCTDEQYGIICRAHNSAIGRVNHQNIDDWVAVDGARNFDAPMQGVAYQVLATPKSPLEAALGEIDAIHFDDDSSCDLVKRVIRELADSLGDK